MKKSTFLCFLVSLLPVAVLADSGLMSIKSQHDFATTTERLDAALQERGLMVLARVSHSRAAEKAGLELRPTELFIFGNPKMGTPLMHCAQTVGIDLPMKALIWQDEAGQVWFSYNDSAYLAQRHSMTGCDEVLAKVDKALGALAAAATGP